MLERNNLWNIEVEKYLSRVFSSCSDCAKTYELKHARKVPLRSLNRSFNGLVCIDHFHLDNLHICHVKDAYTLFSVGAVVPDTGMESAIAVLDSRWISQFWTPTAIQFDQVFSNEPFQDYLKVFGIESRSTAARRHNKDVLESKHKVIRDIILSLSSDNGIIDSKVIAQQSIQISNDLYRNDVCSSYELAKVFMRPLETGQLPKIIPEDLLNSRDIIMSKRKLNLILRSKSKTDTPVKIGDIVQVFVKLQHEKSGKWTNPKPVLNYDKQTGIVEVPGQNGRKIKAALEDVRFAVTDNEFAIKYQETVDSLDVSLGYSMDSITDESPDMIHEPDDLSDRGEIGPTIDLNIGGKIEVYWPLDIEYYPGTVTTYDGATGFHGINYDDGDHESLDMDKETWRVLQSSRSNCVDLSSVHKEALEAYYKSFAHKEFMIHQAEGLPPHPVWNAYKEEESKFMKTVREVSIDKVPKDSNVITSHVIYKVKANDNGSLKMKARIAPHGNKDKDRFELKTDSAQCPPTGIRILASVSTIMKWPIAKIDFASAFLQTGDAKRDVYVIPPRECRRRSNYWLLLTSAYGLVNANAKWQEHCDYLFSSLGLLQSRYVPQLFFSKGKGLEILAVKIVDDVLIADSRPYI